MKGIILAAGRGSRMGTLTNERPKCLTELAGKTLLEWQIQAMHMAGIEDIAIVAGYQKSHLERFGCEMVVNPRWSQTNMVASLCCASEVLARDACIVSYSDIVYHPDVVRRLMHRDADIAISYDAQWQQLWQARFEDPLSDAETFLQRDGFLREIGRRTNDMNRIRGQYMGLLKFRPAGWQASMRIIQALTAAEIDQLDMTALLQRLLAAEVPVQTVAVQGRWCEVDTEQDLHLYAQKVKTAAGNDWSHDWRW